MRWFGFAMGQDEQGRSCRQAQLWAALAASLRLRGAFVAPGPAAASRMIDFTATIAQNRILPAAARR